MQKNQQLTRNPTNTFLSKQIDHKLLTITHIKRMLPSKTLILSQDQLNKLQCYDRFLRYLKKQIKDQKMCQVEISYLCHGYFQEFYDFVRGCYWGFRLGRTDFQALFVKLRFAEEKKKNKTDLQQVIKYQTKKQGDYLLKCKGNLLLQLRNEYQDFQLSSLIKKSTNILTNLPYCSSFTAQQNKSLQLIITQIAKSYNIMPFHNFTHGFSVSTSFYCLMQLQGLNGLLDQCQFMFCIIACLAHDIQHQGLNTLFQVKVNSQLASDFGKFTVIEKMHLSKILEILVKKQQTKKLFDTLSVEERNNARKIISRAILATDMSKHYEYVSQISQNKLDLSTDDKYTVVQAMVHACDIENPSLNFKSYMYWAHLVCIEFHDQTVKERQWSVEVTDFLKFDSLSYFFKNQSNFANTIVYPLWFSLQQLFPSLKAKQFSQKIKKNISILLQALRRNSQPILLHKPFQQYLSEQLQD